MKYLMKFTLQVSMVTMLAACSKSDSGSGVAAKTFTPVQMKAQHKESECPNLSGHYKSADDVVTTSIKYQAIQGGARYRFDDAEMIVDTHLHARLDNGELPTYDYMAFCANQVLFMQLEHKGKVLGTRTYSRANAHGDLQVVDYSGSDQVKSIWTKQ